MRVDHQGQCLHFGEAGLEGDASMRHQLQTLAASLTRVAKQQAQNQAAEAQAAREAQRLAFFKKVRQCVRGVWGCGCGWNDGWCGIGAMLT